MLMSNSNESNSNKPNSVQTKTSKENDKSEDLVLVEYKNIEKEFVSRRRKLHKSYITTWSKDIATNGYARCIIATCNFISSNISNIQTHHKTCNGVPCYNENFCSLCESYVATSEELLSHVVDCKGVNKLKSQKNVMDGKNEKITKNYREKSSNRLESWENQINVQGHAYCGHKQCNFVGTKLSELELHRKTCTGVENVTSFCCPRCRFVFSNNASRLAHESNCQAGDKSFQAPPKKDENLHFRMIQKLKDKDLDDHIVQPSPDLPRGQYMRRRPYTKQHKNSWLTTLEKCKYVKCIFQNCYFIAMSLEDMISHFGYCNGDGSFANFVCPHCKGRVTSEAILLKHIERSHRAKLPSDEEKIELIQSTEDELQNDNEKLTEPSSEGNLRFKKDNSSSLVNDVRCSEDRKSAAGNNVTNSEKSTENNSRHQIEPFNQLGDTEKHLKTYFKQRKLKQKPVPEVNSLSEPEVSIEEPTEVSVIETNDDESLNNDEKNKSKDLNEEDVVVKPEPKKRGRKPKRKIEEKENPNSKIPKKNEEQGNGDEVKCGKCDFRGNRKSFNHHNVRKHVGLGWIEGEEPVDLENEKEVTRLVKLAFKVTKKGTCELCQDVKKSFMGFVSHIQNCGKSREEKDALKVQCPHCSAKCLKYCLSSHIKFNHSRGPSEERTFEVSKETAPAIMNTSRKRLSAVRAVSKFQEVLKENDEPELCNESNYFLYEKSETDEKLSKLPKLCSKLSNIWYKLKRENKKIPCCHDNCKVESSDVLQAKRHHFTCSRLPDKVFMCAFCEFYSKDESVVKSHVTVHKRVVKEQKTRVEEERIDLENEENEDDEDDEDDDDSGDDEGEEEMISDDFGSDLESCDSLRHKKRKRKKGYLSGEQKRRKKNSFIDFTKGETDDEIRHKQNFCRKENIENIRGHQFYSKGLEMTFEDEMEEVEDSESWPELHTQLKDWCHVPPEVASLHFPELTESVSVCFTNKKEPNWRKFKRFESDLTNDVPVIFVGGSVRSMSWCKVSVRRMIRKAVSQYLALAVSKNVDNFKDIKEQSPVSRSSLLQIWNCGVLENAPASSKPEFSVAIVQEGGEIWDLAWFPEDTSAKGTKERLSRLGLLATASEDGAVRIWSVCDPSQLTPKSGLPIYETKPVVKLITDGNVEDSCFRLSVGKGGLLAGGYANGVLAIWNLKSISSPFSKKEGKCQIVKAHLVIQAHRTTITALTFCPSNNRFVSTGGLDRVIKLWDLELPSFPSEQNTRELCLDCIWTRNWPLIIYNFDDVLPNNNRGFVKFVRHVLSDRHLPCIILKNVCLSVTFSDWLNALCGGSNIGEVTVRLLKSFIHDQKKNEKAQSTLSSLNVQKLNVNENEKEQKSKDEEGNKEAKSQRHIPSTYEEIQSSYGLVISDQERNWRAKNNEQYHPEEFPIRAINKVCFNPNFKSFTHVAVGYNCGLVRILRLKDLQSDYTLKSFLSNAQTGKV